jgi:hypothetical protein
VLNALEFVMPAAVEPPNHSAERPLSACAQYSAGVMVRPITRIGLLKPRYVATPPILSWTRRRLFAEVPAPDWWDDTLESLFPLEGDARPSSSTFSQPGGQTIEAWELRRPAEGYVLCLSDGSTDQFVWAQDQAAYLDFITSRGAKWLGLTKAR